MTVAPNIRMLQFIPSGVGFGPIGKNERTKITQRKTIEMMFRGSPARPSLNLEGRSGSPRMRFKAMQEIETIYDAIIAAVDKDAMLMRAAEDPRLMRERRHETPNARQIALIGTSNLGDT